MTSLDAVLDRIEELEEQITDRFGAEVSLNVALDKAEQRLTDLEGALKTVMDVGDRFQCYVSRRPTGASRRDEGVRVDRLEGRASPRRTCRCLC